MMDRMENLRLAFPAEITAAYFGATQIFNSVGTPSENEGIAWVVIAFLLLANVQIYRKFYKVQNPFYFLFISIGFLIWAINIDGARFNDRLFGNQELIAGLCLVLYPVVSMFMATPKPVER